MKATKTPGIHFYQAVYATVSKIPKGKVTTYGHIALLLGKPRAARAVGYALSALPKNLETKIPWQRVINAQGRISFKGDSIRAQLQKKILLSERVSFEESSDRVDFGRYGWFP